MSVEMRAYDNEHGDPVVVLVTTGTYDVSRLVGLLWKGRCEDRDLADRVRSAVKRHNGGRVALRLLRDHGGPDFTDQPVMPARNEATRAKEDGPWWHQAAGRDLTTPAHSAERAPVTEDARLPSDSGASTHSSEGA